MGPGYEDFAVPPMATAAPEDIDRLVSRAESATTAEREGSMGATGSLADRMASSAAGRRADRGSRSRAETLRRAELAGLQAVQRGSSGANTPVSSTAQTPHERSRTGLAGAGQPSLQDTQEAHGDPALDELASSRHHIGVVSPQAAASSHVLSSTGAARKRYEAERRGGQPPMGRSGALLASVASDRPPRPAQRPAIMREDGGDQGTRGVQSADPSRYGPSEPLGDVVG